MGSLGTCSRPPASRSPTTSPTGAEHTLPTHNQTHLGRRTNLRALVYLHRVFFFEVTEDVCLERVTLRATDPVTGERSGHALIPRYHKSYCPLLTVMSLPPFLLLLQVPCCDSSGSKRRNPRASVDPTRGQQGECESETESVPGVRGGPAGRRTHTIIMNSPA